MKKPNNHIVICNNYDSASDEIKVKIINNVCEAVQMLYLSVKARMTKEFITEIGKRTKTHQVT